MNVGYYRPSSTKPVRITLIVPDLDAWYEHFRKIGVETLTRPRDIDELNPRMFLLEDPEGYVIEMQRFYRPQRYPTLQGSSGGGLNGFHNPFTANTAALGGRKLNQRPPGRHSEETIGRKSVIES